MADSRGNQDSSKTSITDKSGDKRQEILQQIRDNPFISQRDLALRLQISRSAVAAHISALTKAGEIVGRAYVLPDRQRIVCIGGANVDRKIQTVDPIQLGTSNPSFVVESHGGVARNIAENLARLGLAPSLLTMVGEDKEGEMLINHLSGVGADVSQIIRLSGHRTGTYTAILDVDGSMTVAFADMEIYDGFTVERLSAPSRAFSGATLAIVDTNLPAESLAYVISESAKTGTALLVAPVSSPKARRLPRDLQGVHALIANLDEVAAISGMSTESDADLERACTALTDRGCAVIVVTLGQGGVFWRDARGNFEHLPADHVEVVDVTGAGDAFVAGFAYATMNSANVKQACQFAMRLSRLALSTKNTVSTEIEPGHARAWLTEILATS